MRRKQLDIGELKRHQQRGVVRQFKVSARQMAPEQAQLAWNRLWWRVRDIARGRMGSYVGTGLLWEYVSLGDMPQEKIE